MKRRQSILGERKFSGVRLICGIVAGLVLLKATVVYYPKFLLGYDIF